MGKRVDFDVFNSLLLQFYFVDWHSFSFRVFMQGFSLVFALVVGYCKFSANLMRTVLPSC